ncbi:diguanylate cyclase [Rossellomorea aquimaris]|uniref:diguanylate cyclase n=1 Tax=Rossellomorea aquimaris TaxID=189382 RepID=UPI001CD2643F|nr:diguanylate cyclase [Rossellomorea aquimaris]MCA1055627.1 diguanylate cyclase [Rossellomorea aquimaris]
MISDLVVNISLLMSFTFVWHQLFRKNRLTMSSPVQIKIIDGLLAGFLGIILMHYSIGVNEMTILDLRHIPVVLVAFYGGFLPAFISAVVIIVGRFLIAVNFSSFIALFMMLVIALGAGLIVTFMKGGAWKRWTALLFYSQLIFSIALYIVVDNYWDVLQYALFHVLSTIIGGYLTFYFVDYIRKNTERYYRYKENALRDALTGLNNVRSFDTHYNRMIKESMDEKVECAICLIDVDHFKQINDTYGHTAGDEVLKQLAGLLKGLTRSGDILSRNGGEEFSLLLPKCTVGQAKDIATRVREAVSEFNFTLPDQRKIQLTVSVGVSAFNPDEGKEEALFQDADEALYKAKQSGRNIVCTSWECSY